MGVLFPIFQACDSNDEEITPTATDTPSPSTPDGETDAFTVVDYIITQENLTSLETALTAAQLTETLRATGPFTVFVPNNEAFAALLANQQVASLEALVEKLGVEAVSNILQAHVVNGLIRSDDVRDKDVLTTLSGATLTATVSGGELFINGAKVIEADLATDNGVVHVINQVVNLSAASDGSNGFTVTIENISIDKRFFQYGTFDTPVEGAQAGPAASGQSYEFSLHAGPVVASDQPTRISFAAKLTGTHDQFLSTDQNGLILYTEAGQPITGDITDQIYVYDAGTKDDTGADVTGPGPVQKVASATNVATVTISNTGSLFTVKITNIQAEGGISPGAYGVHTISTPLFGTTRSVGTDGLKSLAEDGDPAALLTTMASNEDFAVPLSPGLFAVHGSEVRPVLAMGQPDRGKGLEELAEEGNPSQLAAAVANNTEVDSSGTFGTSYIGPGEQYTFRVDGVAPGDYLTLVTRMGQSNDIVYSTPENGIPLFRENGRPFNGNASKLMIAYDVGTEANEYPGAGLYQSLRGSGGEADTNPQVRRVVNNDVDPSEDGFIYRPVGERIRVTITPN